MPAPSFNNKKSSPINTLDQFRGIAILLVLLLHSITSIIKIPRPDTYNPISNLIYAGSTGVTLFFILSGILVTRPFFQGLKNNTTPSLSNYATQRALRILPVYWTAVFIAVIYSGTYHQLIPALFFQLENVNLGTWGLVWWSLVVEVKFYIVLPLLFLILRIRHGGKILAGIAACWAAIFILVAVNPDFGAFITNKSLITKMPAFLVGIAISYWYENHRKTTTKTAYLSALGIGAIIALSVWLKPMAMMTAGYRMIHPLEIVVESLLWGIAIVCFLAQEKSGARSAIFSACSAPLKFLAKISYSLYLFHMPAIIFCLALTDVSATQKLMTALLLSIVLSTISHMIIEKPFLKLKERIHKTSALKAESQMA